MAKDDFLLIGKIVGIHGVRGVLRLHPFTETDVFFQAGKTITLVTVNGERGDYRILAVKPHKRNLLVSLQGVEDPQRAEMFRGAEAVARRSDFPELEADTYYWADLIGMNVFTGKGRLLGRIESIFPTGSNDVFVVREEDTGKEVLIPALATVIAKIDPESGSMSVNLPEGLA